MDKGTALKVIFFPDYINDSTIVLEPKDNFIPGHYSNLGFGLYDNSGWGYNSDSYLKDRLSMIYNKESDRIIEAELILSNHGSCKIEIYENKQIIPTRIKRIKW